MKTITQTSGFSSDRFLQLCKRFIAINQRTWAIGFAGALGLVIVVWLMQNYLGVSGLMIVVTIRNLTSLLFLLGGLIITSSMFNELHYTSSPSQIYTLPASTFEKLFAAWFLSYFCYTIIGVVIMYFINMILGFTPLIPEHHDIVTPMADKYGEIIGSSILTYTTYHSIFLLGAVYFRKNNLIKTALCIILFFLSLGVIFILLFFVLGTESFKVQMSAEAIFGLSGLRIAISIAVTFLFFFFSYIRLKNRQVA